MPRTCLETKQPLQRSARSPSGLRGRALNVRDACMAELLHMLDLDHLTQHAIACAGITSVCFCACRHQRGALVRALMCAATVGIAKEVGDAWELWPHCRRRRCEWDIKDLIADVVGAAVAACAVIALSRRRQPVPVSDERKPLALAT